MSFHSVVKGCLQNFGYYGLSASNLLRRSLLEERNEISPLLRLLDAREHHLRPRDELLRVQQVLEQRVLPPHRARVLVRRRVRVSGDGPALAAEEAVQVRPLLRGAACLVCVALRALRLEDLQKSKIANRTSVAFRLVSIGRSTNRHWRMHPYLRALRGPTFRHRHLAAMLFANRTKFSSGSDRSGSPLVGMKSRLRDGCVAIRAKMGLAVAYHNLDSHRSSKSLQSAGRSIYWPMNRLPVSQKRTVSKFEQSSLASRENGDTGSQLDGLWMGKLATLTSYAKLCAIDSPLWEDFLDEIP